MSDPTAPDVPGSTDTDRSAARPRGPILARVPTGGIGRVGDVARHVNVTGPVSEAGGGRVGA